MNILSGILLLAVVAAGGNAAHVETKRSLCAPDYPISGVVNVAFLCDKKCNDPTIWSTSNIEPNLKYLLDQVTAAFSKFSDLTFVLAKVNMDPFDHSTEVKNLENDALLNGDNVPDKILEYWTTERLNYHISTFKADTTIFLSNYDSQSEVSGAAKVPGVCTAQYSGAIVNIEGLSLNNRESNDFRQFERMVIHEIAHQFGILHDDKVVTPEQLIKTGSCQSYIEAACGFGGNSYFMGASAGSASSTANSFSECSKYWFYDWQNQAQKPDAVNYNSACIEPAVVIDASGAMED
jgi:hypothetical protein